MNSSNMSEAQAGATVKSICVFCGSSQKVDQHYFDLAAQTGKVIANAQLRLVYGGGGVGLMGACAKAAHEAGGDVLGVIPEFLQAKEITYEDVPHEVVPDMQTRKKIMYDAADAFIVLPGGIGTLEEAIEVISWMRIDLHSKPIVFVDNDDYWTPVIELINHTIEAKFSPEKLRDHLHRVTSPKDALALIEAEWELPDESFLI